MGNNNQSYEPEFIKEWCVFILNFFHSTGKTQALYENLTRQTLKHYNENNKKGLKEMLHTVYSVAFTSPENDKVQLDEKLFEKFGKKLEDVKPQPIKHRALKGEKLEQLKFMGNWCIAILEYMKNSVPNDPAGFFSGSIDTINKAVESNNFQGIKMVYNDTNEMARGLSSMQLEELNKILSQKFGRSLIDEENGIQKKIDQIIERGKMVSDEEFYLVTSYFDELIIADNKTKIEKLNKILFEYEKSKKSIDQNR